MCMCVGEREIGCHPNKRGENGYARKVVSAIPYKDLGYFLVINRKSLTRFLEEQNMIGCGGERNRAGKTEHAGSVGVGIILRGYF